MIKLSPKISQQNKNAALAGGSKASFVTDNILKRNVQRLEERDFLQLEAFQTDILGHFQYPSWISVCHNPQKKEILQRYVKRKITMEL